MPEPIDIPDLSQIDEEGAEKLLIAIRERRLDSIRHYEEAQALAEEARRQGRLKDLVKKLDMLTRAIDRAQKAEDNLSKRLNHVRALRMELEL